MENLGFPKKSNVSPLYLTFIIHYPEQLAIPDNKKLAFTYRNLEKILGGKIEPDFNVKSDDTIETYNLNNLQKINNNIKIEDISGSDSGSESEHEPHMYSRSNHFSEMPGRQCAQQ